jgi:DNA-binding GntR family transcriptional regulator
MYLHAQSVTYKLLYIRYRITTCRSIEEDIALELLTLKEIAYRHIRNGILTGVWKPGERLREDLISHELGMSRTPVREACNLLVAQGMIKNERRLGLFVAQWNSDDLTDLIDVRESLELLAITKAVERMTADMAKELRKRADAYEQAVRLGKHAQALARDKDFHAYIIEMSQNRHLKRILTDISSQMELARVLHCNDEAGFTASCLDHRQIAELLASGDANGAKEAMHRHLDRVRKELKERLKQTHNKEEEHAEQGVAH